MRRTKKGKRTDASWKKACDKLFSQRVRAIGHCECCLKTKNQLHVHHLISRAVLFYRWNFENAICLCARCHEFDTVCSAHATPWEFEEWMKVNKPLQYDWWLRHRYRVHPGHRPDYEVIHAELKDYQDISKTLGI